MISHARTCATAPSVLLLTTMLALALGAPRAHAQDAGVDDPAPPSDAGAPSVAEGEGDGEPDAPDGAPVDDAPVEDAPVDEEPDTEAPPEDSPEPTPIARDVDPRTGLDGVILDAETSVPLADAPVVIRGPRGPRETTQTTITDEEGRFHLPTVPGVYTILAYYDLYHGAQIRVRVTRGRMSPVRLVLDPIDEEEDVAVDAVEVTYRADASGAAATQALQAAATDTRDAASSETMSRSGASDAGAGAALVPGVLVENSRPIIRGLSGQYVITLLNGTPIPSTDPALPGVDLDLFPTSIIQNLAIIKTFVPSMSAAWAGGVVDISTVQFPTKFTLQLGASVGANTQTTFQPTLDYHGGRFDWTGFDHSRDLPSDFPNELLQASRERSTAEVNAAGRELPNVWQFHRSTGLPNMGLSGTLGNSYRLGQGRRFGYLLTFGYNNDTARTTGTNRSLPTFATDGSLVVRNDLTTETATRDVGLNLLGTASLDLTVDQSLSLLVLYNRSTQDQVEQMQGVLGEIATGAQVERWQLDYVARTLFFTQLRGDHRNLGNTELRLRWTLFAGQGQRDEPDRRAVLYGPNGAYYRWLDKSSSGLRLFSTLDQRDLGGELSLQIPLWSTAAGEARALVGGNVHRSDRTFLIRRFSMLQSQNPPVEDQSVFQAPPEELFSADAIGTLTRFWERTRSDDSYVSSQTLYAGFLQLETPLTRSLEFTGGARLEVFDQYVQSRSPFATSGESSGVNTNRTDVNVLPTGSFKLALSEDMNLRLGYGMTAVRPQIRQLAPYQYYDFQRNRIFVGDPNIQSTIIHNVDLRWEWFFSANERLTLSAFYKNLDGFIYTQVIDPNNYGTTFRNTASGYVAGGEIDFVLGLGRIHQVLHNFSLQGNFALLTSHVELVQNERQALPNSSPVPGQAPYVANLSLRFDESDAGFAAALVYNVVGPRVEEVGVLANDRFYPNLRRMPFHQLDFIASWMVNEHLKLKFKFKNMLFQTQRWQLGSYLESTSTPGANISIGIDYNY